ncbi:MAG: hypothetical protein C0517_05900 [Erythrobacter sp.]|nr:hypothetical protein [Erythrobacter sp.]
MKLNSLTFIAATSVLFTFAPTAAQAQEDAAASPGSPSIVVEGRKQQVREELKNLIEVEDDQLARFESEFCPKVIGFDPEWTPILEQLIRDNVVAVGMKAEPAPCKPTAVVIFSYDPQDLVKGLRQRMPGLFEGMPIPQLDRLTGEARGAYSWRAVDMRSRDGITLQPAGDIGGSPSQAKIVRNAAGSRLVSSVRYDIVNSYLVLDLERTPGMSLNQIAAFATMHLLLDLTERAPEVSRSTSILRLFSGDDPATLPPELSRFDRLTLEGLYRIRFNNVSASQQRSRMVKHISQNEAEE